MATRSPGLPDPQAEKKLAHGKLPGVRILSAPRFLPDFSFAGETLTPLAGVQVVTYAPMGRIPPMKNLIVCSVAALVASCSGGGSSSDSEAQASGNDFFLVEQERVISMDVLGNDGEDWRDPDRAYSLLIVESSTFDRTLKEGSEFFLEDGFELSYDPVWSMQSAWGIGDAFDTREVDSFKYAIWDVHGSEVAFGPVTVTIEWIPQLFVVEEEEGGHDNNPGTRDQPLATVYRALELAQPGDVIQICNDWEIDPWGGDVFPWVVTDGVLLRGRTSKSIVWGQGEYLSESMQNMISASVVLEGEGAGVANLNLSPSARGEIEAGLYIEGRDLKVWNSRISGFEVGILCLDSEDITLQDIQVSSTIGIYALGTQGECVLRDSGVTDCEFYGILLARPNDLDLGTAASPGNNWIVRNHIGLAWQVQDPEGLQDAYGNEWNEYPLSLLVNDHGNPDTHYDVFQEQIPFIDSRGGQMHEL